MPSLPDPGSLLSAVARETAQVTDRITELEHHKEAIEAQLAELRSLRAELLATADALNRETLKSTTAAPHTGPASHLRVIRSGA